MSTPRHIETLGDRYNVSAKQARGIAEELCHATYLVCNRELHEEKQKLALAFEERIKGLESQIATLMAERNG